jgi:hypothetical protein
MLSNFWIDSSSEEDYDAMDVLPSPAHNQLKRAADLNDVDEKVIKRMKTDGRRIVSVFYMRNSGGVPMNEKMCVIDLETGDTPKVSPKITRTGCYSRFDEISADYQTGSGKTV